VQYLRPVGHVHGRVKKPLLGGRGTQQLLNVANSETVGGAAQASEK
jgi:hypothetical protein